MRPFLFLSLISACYAPKPAEGVPCDVASPHCPTGQTCQPSGVCSSSAIGDTPDAARADAATDAPPIDATDDRDGDGVKDDADNCPDDYNPGQENEDGDRFGDVCDPCPPHADDNPTDTDGDGISDDCDPHPKDAGDRIVLFEGFHHGIPDSWSKTGNWFHAGDDAIGNENNSGVILLGDANPVLQGGDEIVTIGARMDAANASPDQQAIGIATTVGADGHGATCGLVRDASVTPSKPGFELYDAFDGAQIAYGDWTWNIGDDFSIAISRYGEGYWCDVWNDDIYDEINGTYTMHPDPDGWALWVHAAKMRVHWVMIIATP